MLNRVVPSSHERTAPAHAPSIYRQLVARCTACCDSATVAFDPVWTPSIWRAIPSLAGRAPRQERIRTFPPLSGSSSVCPSIKQATKVVAALLLAFSGVPGAMFLSSRALLYPYYGALVAIMLFGALEVAVELLVAGDSDRRRGRSKLQGQRKLER